MIDSKSIVEFIVTLSLIEFNIAILFVFIPIVGMYVFSDKYFSRCEEIKWGALGVLVLIMISYPYIFIKTWNAIETGEASEKICYFLGL